MVFVVVDANTRVRHYMDSTEGNVIKNGTALCGESGSKMKRFTACFFNYKAVYPKVCKKCLKILQQNPGAEVVEN